MAGNFVKFMNYSGGYLQKSYTVDAIHDEIFFENIPIWPDPDLRHICLQCCRTKLSKSENEYEELY